MYIDFSVLAYRNLFSMKSMIDQFGFDILRHVFIKNIIAYVRDFEPDRVYIGIDVGKSWRKKVYSLYKGKRKEAREKQDVEWEKFYEICNNVTDELKNNFPFYVIGINHVEADDIIGYLVKNDDPDNEKIVITSDKDYVQLIKYPNTKIYDPIKKKFMECSNPLHALEVKICSGDKSDNIPSIAPRWGEKTAEKHILSGKLQLMLEEKDNDGDPCEIKRNYERNKRLVDLSRLPKSVEKGIELYLEDYSLSSHKGLMKYFVQNKLNELLGEIAKIRGYLDNLT
jgi:DNA polymerase-1